MTHRIFLVGYRGTGKTSIGKRLASKLNRPFLDTDLLIESAAGRSIREIFEHEGELGFRNRESDALLSACKHPGVIATGGGIILRPENRSLLKTHGYVIWLSAPAEVCFARMQQDSTTADRRPNLTTGGLNEVIELIQRREPYYREVANLIVDTNLKSPESIVDHILAEIKLS